MAAVSSLVLAAAAAASVAGGVQSYNEGKKQAGRAEEQAAIAAAETKRQTDRSVMLEQRNIKDTQDRQRLAYLASGVTLEGSPLLKLEETRRRGAENIDEIQQSGNAGAAAQIAEGRMTAKSAKATGRQALIGGITNAGGSLARMA
jgi:hypothetical protein